MENINTTENKSTCEIVENFGSILETNLPEDELQSITLAAAESFQVNKEDFETKPFDELYGIGHMSGFYTAYSKYVYGDFKETIESHHERTIAEDIPAEIKHYAFEAILKYYQENKKPLNNLISQELYIIAYRNGYEQGSLIFENVEKYRENNKKTLH